MRKTLLGALLLFASLSGWSQVTHPPSIVPVGSAPSGSCSTTLPDKQVTVAGTLYSCQNGTWAQIGSGAGGTCGSNNIPCTNTANTYTGIQSAPGFAGTGATQTVVNMTQGTAAPAPPANSIQFGSPLTVTSSYDMYLPILAPTLANSCPAWPNGGGTAVWVAPAEVLLLEQSVSVAVASVTFSSIPQTYKHLRIVYSVSTAASGDSMSVQFNGDTGSNYSTNLVFNSGSTAGGFATTGTQTNVGLAGNTGDFATGFVYIANYSGATNKGVAGSSGDSAQAMTAGGRWSSTAAITSIKLFSPSANNIQAGSVISLYGVN